MRVLIVDDHKNTRESLALGLRLLGHASDAAASAAEALARIEEHPYEWLISDVRMPELSGLELATMAHERCPDLGLILMTAYDVTTEERRLIDSLGAVLVIKPATATSLAALCGVGDQAITG